MIGIYQRIAQVETRERAMEILEERGHAIQQNGSFIAIVDEESALRRTHDGMTAPHIAEMYLLSPKRVPVVIDDVDIIPLGEKLACAR